MLVNSNNIMIILLSLLFIFTTHLYGSSRLLQRVDCKQQCNEKCSGTDPQCPDKCNVPNCDCIHILKDDVNRVPCEEGTPPPGSYGSSCKNDNDCNSNLCCTQYPPRKCDNLVMIP
eukprot:818435_1